jgi:hypothetical protein
MKGRFTDRSYAIRTKKERKERARKILEVCYDKDNRFGDASDRKQAIEIEEEMKIGGML